MQIATSIEFLHTASIILDDLPAMDDGLLRRGARTCHLDFGQPAAILTALWLCDAAQHFLHEFQFHKGAQPGCDLENHIRSTRSQMMSGQMLDIQSCANSEEEILEIYRLKSGVLFGFAAAAPAWVLGLKDQAERLYNFGHFFGTAYQISDDIDDMVASERDLGKDVRKDANKPTIPRIFGLERAQTLRDTYKQKAINELQQLGKPINDLIGLVEKIISSS